MSQGDLRDHLQREQWIQLNLRLCSDDVFLQMEARGGYFAQKEEAGRLWQLRNFDCFLEVEAGRAGGRGN